MRPTALLAFAAIALAAPAVPAADTKYDPRAAFAETDSNKDGKVDRAEFVERITDVFFLGDVNKDGSLSPQELKDAVVIEESWAEADTNKDGKVTLAEFQRVRMILFDRADENGDGILAVDEVVEEYEVGGRRK